MIYDTTYSTYYESTNATSTREKLRERVLVVPVDCLVSYTQQWRYSTWLNEETRAYHWCLPSYAKVR
jgi:hypothetical protein